MKDRVEELVMYIIMTICSILGILIIGITLEEYPQEEPAFYILGQFLFLMILLSQLVNLFVWVRENVVK